MLSRFFFLNPHPFMGQALRVKELLWFDPGKHRLVLSPLMGAYSFLFTRKSHPFCSQELRALSYFDSRQPWDSPLCLHWNCKLAWVWNSLNFSLLIAPVLWTNTAACPESYLAYGARGRRFKSCPLQVVGEVAQPGRARNVSLKYLLCVSPPVSKFYGK